MNDTNSAEMEEYHGWPGDGSGEDDLADYNQNEVDDYRDEGVEMDRANRRECDSMNEGLEESDETPLGMEYERE